MRPLLPRREFLIQALSAAGPGALFLPGAARGAPSLAIGLIFVGASWCPYCKAAAPLLRDIAAAEELPLLVVSKDEKPIPPFPEVVAATGHPIADQIEAIPAVLLYAPSADRIVARVDGFRGAAAFRAEMRRAFEEAAAQGFAHAF